MAFKKVILHTAVLDNCRASVCFTVLSPNVVVIVATVLNRGHDGGRPALKALQGQRALARGHVDSGEVRRAELHAADEVSRSVLRTGTQRQDKKVPSDEKFACLPINQSTSSEKYSMRKVQRYFCCQFHFSGRVCYNRLYWKPALCDVTKYTDASAGFVKPTQASYSVFSTFQTRGW